MKISRTVLDTVELINIQYNGHHFILDSFSRHGRK